MSGRRLPSGRELVYRTAALSAFLSLPGLLVVVAMLIASLRLTSAQWGWLSTLGLACAGVASLVIYQAQKVIAAPVSEWLDIVARGQATVDESGTAFTAVMALPVRAAIACSVGWLISAIVTCVGMTIVSLGWGLTESGMFCAAAITMALAVGILNSLLLKMHVAGIREALVSEIPDPSRRHRLVRTLALRPKLSATIGGLALVPVVIAALLSVDSGRSSVEEFATGWQAHLLESLPAVGPGVDLDAARRLLERSPIAVPVQLGLLPEVESDLGPHLAAQIRKDISLGQTQGDSRGLPSDIVFSWRLLSNRDVVLAYSPSALMAFGGAEHGVAFVLLLILSVGLALLAAKLIADDVSRAIDSLRGEADRLASGDLRPGQVFESEDEMGELGRSFQAMASSLCVTVHRVSAAADRVEATARQITPISGNIAQVTADQVSGIEQATSSMEEINAQVRGIAGSSRILNGSVEESSSSILELGASGEELNETASLLSSRVEDVSTSIEQMVRSVKQVSGNTETLSSAAIETCASMEEMASSLREMDISAEETARLSSQVVVSAESGQTKVHQTIEGMEAIQEATDTAERVIRSLHSRTDEIGAIVDVIDDVADETNLLALNAAIIAAQAGEHGKAFSVVADEIKDLAERVLASTKEIGALIAAVQGEAGNAIGAIEGGSSSVASGVELSAQAGMALEEITRASRGSGERITRIVNSLREQTKAAGHVVGLMGQVREGVDQIRAASAEQDRGNVIVFEGSVTMRDVAKQVRSTTEEQAHGSGRIRESIEGVRSAVEQINGALQEQSLACSAAVEFLEEVRSRTRANEESAQMMDSVTKELSRQAGMLRDEIDRFEI